MGFTLTAAPKKRIKTPRTPRGKTASGDFFQNPNESRLKNRPQPLRTQQGKTAYSYKIVSGRPVWPSRDPLGDIVFFNQILQGLVERYTVNGVLTRRIDSIIEDLTEETVVSLYQFVRNDTSNSFDVLGLDRDVVNKYGHGELKIDKWKNQNGKWVKDGSVRYGFGPLLPAEFEDDVWLLKGQIWQNKDEEVSGTKSTPCQDNVAHSMIAQARKNPPSYHPLLFHCWTWALAAKQFGMAGKGECCNPDGTVWERP